MTFTCVNRMCKPKKPIVLPKNEGGEREL